jgi:hypothetical protein
MHEETQQEYMLVQYEQAYKNDKQQKGKIIFHQNNANGFLEYIFNANLNQDYFDIMTKKDGCWFKISI